MRVVVPFHPAVHRLARAALERFAPAAEYVALGESRTAYWQLLATLWGTQDPFIVVEHDVEIHERSIRALTYCPRPWCVFPYAGPLNYGQSTAGVMFDQALGCTRFRSGLVAAHPDLLASIGAGESDPSRARNWQGLDSHVAGRLRAHGHRPHVHLPAVTHHHEYPSGCACGREHE